MNKKCMWLFLAMASMAVINGCSKKDDPTPQPPSESTTTIGVNFPVTSSFTFFSFKNNAIVANTDSATAKWDFALRLTTFLVNSNASGPGNAGVIVQDGIFDNIILAPSTGYSYDTTSSKLAIKDGTWYNYNTSTRSFVPKAGKVFVFRTADNKFAKMEILETTYEPFVGPTPQRINYKIRFVFQPDGSGNIKK